LKQPGSRIYLLGNTLAEFGGSLLNQLQSQTGGTPPTMPAEPLQRYRLLHQAIRQGWVQACHDLSEGGLAVALAEMAMGGRLGAQVTLPAGETSATAHLFAESNGRLLLEVTAEDAPHIERHFGPDLLHYLGVVSAEPVLQITQATLSLVDLPVEQLLAAWQPQAAAVAGA
jgi:phosphoribosylformylglycinamidine synthase subunit PurSL